MRVSSSLVFLMSLAVSASAFNTCRATSKSDSIFCQINADIVKILHQEAEVTAYCSMFLSIPTKTL